MKKPKEKAPFNKSRLRSAIRREWLYSELRKQALASARVERGLYKCSTCSKIVGPKEIEINHKLVCTPDDGLNTGKDWGIFIERLLYVNQSGLEALCEACHKIVSAKEKEQKAKNKLAKKKTK
jgi:hypothetical protein